MAADQTGGDGSGGAAVMAKRPNWELAALAALAWALLLFLGWLVYAVALPAVTR